ncbi:benzoate-CoA ligase family protein [Pendulispora albinea]|uniref:Benzoate-CoA ligase family protein n=1 Tax=Pendulispora albinea TaxID=2741071 RepID=A0ABZ2LKV4_9BACT
MSTNGGSWAPFPRRYNAAVDLVDRHVTEGRAERIAFRDDRRTVTYGELARRVNRAGNALLGLGMEPEQRVMLLMHDTIDFPAVFLGAIKAGLVPVPVNTLLTTEDYAHFLSDSRARALVVSEALLPKVEAALGGAAKLRSVIVAGAGDALDAANAGRGGGVPEGSRYERLEVLLEGADDALEAAPTTPDDVAFWFYSSGSTGAPKGAIHLHSHLMQTARLYAQGVLGIREDDIVFSAAKLFFAYGLGNSLTFPLSVGASSVLMAERPTPASVLRVLREHRPTIFCGVPTLFAAMLADANVTREAGSPALRVCTSAGEALPKHVGEKWRKRMGCDILDGIGTTEMLHIFLSNRPGEVRYGTSGRPVPGYELKVLGDDGVPAAAGEEGSLWVHGPTAAIAYWNQRDASRATFHGPWTRTGDRYVRDAEGYFTYLGRTDDMLKVGGIWVSPFEVESALAAHEAVLEAAVVGHADADQLVKPKAFVVLRPGVEESEALSNELKEFVKKTLAPYKYPRWVEFVAELPRTATGKIQRFRLRG